MKKTTLINICSLLCVSSLSFATGTKTTGVSTRAQSMGGAYTAISNDASAIFYNPAGLTQINQMDIQLDLFPIFPGIKYTNQYNGFTTSSDYISYGMSTFLAKRLSEKVVIGLDIVAPFARKNVYDESPAVFNFPLISKFVDMNITPVMAISLTDRLSIGGGPTLNYDYLSATIAGFKQKAYGAAASGTISGLYKASDELKIGATYHFQSNVNIGGHSASRGLPVDISAPLTVTYKNPAYLNLGIAYQATEQLLLSVDYERVFWNQVNSFNINYNNPFLDSIIVINGHQSSNYHFGMEYSIKDNQKVRLGYVYLEQSFPDYAVTPVVLDFNGNVYSIGYGYLYNQNWRFDLGYELADAKDTNNNVALYNPFQGIYKAKVSTVLFGVNYKV